MFNVKQALGESCKSREENNPEIADWVGRGGERACKAEIQGGGPREGGWMELHIQSWDGFWYLGTA